jgi:hypothetical protein
MMKRLFNDDDSTTREATDLKNEAFVTLRSLVQRWLTSGYSCRDVEMILHETVQEVASNARTRTKNFSNTR